MGMFSFLDKPFRTGASAAARGAKKAGGETLAQQGAFLEEMRGGYAPGIAQGQEAATSLADFYGGNQQGIIGQAQSSPFYEALQSAGEQGVLRNQAMTGGFRSGTTQENLAQSNQGVLMSLVDQILQGQGQVADRGANAQANFGNIGSNLISGMGGTRGEIANVDIAKAAGKQNMFSGLINAGAKVAAAGM